MKICKACNWSKKLSALVLGVGVLVLDSFGYLKLDAQHVMAIQWSLVAYIAGQSLVDTFLYPEKQKVETASNAVLAHIASGKLPPRLASPPAPPSPAPELDEFD